MAAFGGLTCLTFEKNGDVLVEPLRVAAQIQDQLENNLILFFTGIERSASEILNDQDTKSKNEDTEMVNNLHRIKEIGLETRKYLENGQVDMLGELFNTHWETKKKRSNNISNPLIEQTAISVCLVKARITSIRQEAKTRNKRYLLYILKKVPQAE
jgi:D-glycero-alpha-D-manno-heptose-7-phosphate kinase